jgi:hypothetical protein
MLIILESPSSTAFLFIQFVPPSPLISGRAVHPVVYVLRFPPGGDVGGTGLPYCWW